MSGCGQREKARNLRRCPEITTVSIDDAYRLAPGIFRTKHTLQQTPTMEYQPRYAQPFTLQEALGLDIEIINEGESQARKQLTGAMTAEIEIARLQNSLSKLNDTQGQLRECIDKAKAGSEEPEAEIVEAFEDNVNVM